MAYLSTNKEPNPIVHCDLAARNCLVTDPPVIKIGDFGMAHEVYADYYKKGNPGMMPVRWMAPETLRDGKFSSASDVWSFGVVLWEMVTLAEQPYQGMGNDGAMKYIKNGGTMEKPNECPESIHNLMRNCWRQLPEDRPTFIDICQHLLPHSNQRFLRDSFVTSNDGRLAIAEQQQSRDTQFNIMQDDSINERTQLTNLDTSSYTPSSFTDSTTAPLTTTTGNGNGNSNGNVGGGKGITDNGMPPSMGLQMHNLTSQTISPTSTNDDQSETTNGNHNEILPTTSMHDDINISLVGNDTSSSFQASNSNSNNTLLSRTLANRIRRGIRYIRSNRGQNSGIDDHAGNPRA
jgi:serine/threonine protein kinase